MTVLCLVERDGAGVADASLRALTFARRLAGPGDAEPGGADQGGVDLGGTDPSGADLGGVSQAGGRLAAVLFAGAEALASETPAGQELAGYGVSDAYVIEPGQLPGYAPLAWARVLAGLIETTGATAVLAAGTDRGAEVMAHLGALAGAPMATRRSWPPNRPSAAAGSRWPLPGWWSGAAAGSGDRRGSPAPWDRGATTRTAACSAR